MIGVCRAFALSLILTSAVFLPAARADEEDQMTRLVFNEPVGIPGAVLPAGAYWFVVARDTTGGDVVQIFSDDWSRVWATLITTPTYRQVPADETEIEFAVRPRQKAEALVEWYCPGCPAGHEFLYPKREERELARDAKRDVVAQPVNEASNAAGPHA